MNRKIEIRKISKNDVQSSFDFFNKQLENTFANTFPRKALLKAKDDFSVTNIDKYILQDKRLMIAAFSDDEIVGVMYGSQLNGGVASVIWIVVNPDIRGFGIGKRLMKRTFQEYKKIGAHKVVLYTETTKAKIFYEKIGMKQEGFHKSHWWKVDHYCFAKNLN